MILIGFRHGLRAAELCDLMWSQVELAAGRLHVHRLKSGTYPLQGDEIRALRRLQRESPSSHVFSSERGGPMTPKAFGALLGRIGAWAKMPFPVHPHMLRHACGYALANAGHDTRALQAYLGHKNIQHTVRYSELAADRFKTFWRLLQPRDHGVGFADERPQPGQVGTPKLVAVVEPFLERRIGAGRIDERWAVRVDGHGVPIWVPPLSGASGSWLRLMSPS